MLIIEHQPGFKCTPSLQRQDQPRPPSIATNIPHWEGPQLRTTRISLKRKAQNPLSRPESQSGAVAEKVPRRDPYRARKSGLEGRQRKVIISSLPVFPLDNLSFLTFTSLLSSMAVRISYRSIVNNRSTWLPTLLLLIFLWSFWHLNFSVRPHVPPFDCRPNSS
jgi:hypothetical protein